MSKRTNTYFTGKPCKHGHVAERYVSTGSCLACMANYRSRAVNAYTSGVFMRDFRMWSDDVNDALRIATLFAETRWPDIHVNDYTYKRNKPQEVIVRLPCHDDDFPALLEVVRGINAKRAALQATEEAERERDRAEKERQGFSARQIARWQAMEAQIRRLEKR